MIKAGIRGKIHMAVMGEFPYIAPGAECALQELLSSLQKKQLEQLEVVVEAIVKELT